MRKLFLTMWLLASTIAFSQTNYYVDNVAGNDKNPGTLDKPWKSVTPVNKFNFELGDVLYFKGGQTFGQAQLQNNDIGLTIKSNGGVATLAGMYAYNVGDITLDGLNFKGPGTVNKVDGIKFYMDGTANGDLNNIIIKNTSVSNFGGNGILLGAWATNNGYNNVQILNCNVYGNYVDGIATYGYYDAINHTKLYINNVKTYNNYGRSDVTNTRTGSGVVIGGFDGGTIENSEAYNNGKNNRFSGGGPQGFWCYNSRNLIFQNSISHDNKAGARFDGGGFDIDGGSENCVIQYCYSYNNEGAGFAFFEHGSTNQFNYNTIRYNISQNDARKNAHGAIMMWAQDTFNRVKNSYVYNNTVYVTPSAIASATYPVGLYLKWSNFKAISFYNNILYVTDTIKTVVGSTTNVAFSNNGYYNPSRTPSFTKGGIVKDPLFVNVGGGAAGFVLKGASPMINAGKASSATQDFIGNAVPFNTLYDVGAYEMKVLPPKATAGADKIITMPTNSVTLAGSGTDPDGTIQAYNWTKLSGPVQYSLSSLTSATPTVTSLVEGYYTFRLTVKDNDGAIATDDMQVVVYPAPAPTGSKYIKVNVYGGSNAYANTEWNNWNVSSSLTKTALKYSNGTTSSVGVVLSANSYVSDNGSTYGSGMAPAEVLRYTSTSSATSRTLTINGLSASKTYRLELYGSRNNTGNSTVFTVGTTSQTILTDKNKLYKASFVNLVPNSSGQIIVALKKLNSYTFLNGFMLTELPSTTTAITLADPGMVIEETTAELQAEAFPNPSQQYFTLSIKSARYKSVQLQVVDALGRVIETRQHVATNTTTRVGQSYNPGVYFAEVMQGSHKVVVQLVKAKPE